MTSLPKFSVENPVLVGVLMTTILVGGVYSGLTLVREMFPESRPSQVAITTAYPGAAPEEVEKGVSLKIEEAIKDVEDIEKIETQITEGMSTVRVTMISAAKDIDLVVNDFKAAVDAIPRDELPDDVEETVVAKFEPRLPVISVSLTGEVDEKALKAAGRRLKDDILLLPGISDVKLSGARKEELTVEADPRKLVEYGLSLAQVSDAIRQSNLDLPGGQLKTASQNVAVRTLGETDEADRIAETIVKTTPAGEVVRVRDLGRVVDQFEDVDIRGRFDGRPAVSITVYKTADEDAIDISRKVKAFVAGKLHRERERDGVDRLRAALGFTPEAERIYHRAWNDPYPPTVDMKVNSNLARFIEQRLELLERNGLWGLALVFLSLMAFLNWRIAFWVMMGLVMSVCGALLLMKLLGATLSLISMFGMIIVLGLLVDDAIVVGENVFAWIERGEEPRLAAIKGTEEVTWPVVIAVLTTVGAFLPLAFIEGQIGDFMGVLPVVVGCALSISLLEALSILPSHLAEWLKPVRRDLSAAPARHGLARLMNPVRRAQAYVLQDVLLYHYERLLRAAVRYRYVTVTAGVAGLMICGGFVAGERVPFVFIQKMDSETIVVNLEMPVGTPVERTETAVGVLERAVLEMPEVAPNVQTMYTLVGSSMEVGGSSVASTGSRSHVAQAIIELVEVDQRAATSEDVVAVLRAETSRIPGVNRIKYVTMQGGPGGAEIELEVTGERIGDLRDVAEALKGELARFDGVYDIADDSEEGRREVQVALRDSARPLGVTTRMLATEIRGAFYGLEPRTLQRDREDVDIRVRFPEGRRKEIYDLESMRIATPAGHMVPFSEVATLAETRGYSAIRRVDQRRAVIVSADVDQSRGNADQITASLADVIGKLERSHPGVRIDFAGNKRETMKAFGSLKRDFFIAMGLIFVMLAGLFKSYVQPMIVMTAIPFGLIGAVAGHFVMGYPLTILSMIGLVALTGIVVNDALIMVDFINREVAAGQPVFDAVIAGGRRRLRPILLTSLTTILGLAPLMAESSFQARFLIPMAISISFGLGFATVLTLVAVPAIYMIVDDVTRAAAWVWRGPDGPRRPAVAMELPRDAS